MSVNPETLSVYFLRARPNATERDAIQYASTQYPDRPIAIAQFVTEWRNLRERWLEARHSVREDE